ncbi:hypothetical protein [Yeosuana marina]|uniref:hypothetical protein n=1 Tax=Yeosuana marina TaxID=1565536 RepID=UPI0030C86D37
MKKNLLLYILLLFLIVVNGLFLYNYLGDRSGNEARLRSKRDRDPGAFIVKELRFNDAQLKQVDDLNKKHKTAMRYTLDEIKGFKDMLFSEILLDDVSNSKIDSIIALISKQEGIKEKNTVMYLRGLYNISNEKQKRHFKNIVTDALRMGNPDGPRERRPPPPQ